MHSQLGPYNRSQGSCNFDMDEIRVFRQMELRFIKWQLVIDCS